MVSLHFTVNNPEMTKGHVHKQVPVNKPHCILSLETNKSEWTFSINCKSSYISQTSVRMFKCYWRQHLRNLFNPLYKITLTLAKSMGQSGSLMFFVSRLKWMKLKTERDLSYIDSLTVEFFQNNGTSSTSVIMLTNGRKDGRTNGREFNTSLMEVIKYWNKMKALHIWVAQLLT